jgi:hypothetical protein
MKDEALRLALEALEANLANWNAKRKAIPIIKQALEQSVADSNTSQEPVAKIEKTQHEPFAWYVDFGNEDEPNYFSKTKPDEPRASVKPLYTAPPKRKWQGLTDVDVSKILDEQNGFYTFEKCFNFAKAIEAKLKEKNT